MYSSFYVFLSGRRKRNYWGGSNGNGDFENGSTGWVLVNGTQTNKWVVSNNATPGFTSNCIYISSSATAPYSHTYNTASSAYSYFYKDVAIPAGTTTAWLVFDYIVNGQVDNTPFGPNAKDALRIWTKPTSTVITAGEEVPNIFINAGAGYTWRGRSSAMAGLDWESLRAPCIWGAGWSLQAQIVLEQRFGLSRDYLTTHER